MTVAPGRAGVETCGRLVGLGLTLTQNPALRGRDGHCWLPPGQIRACAANALGSHLGCLTMKRCCGEGWVILVGGNHCAATFAIRSHVTRPFWLRRPSTPGAQRVFAPSSLSYATTLGANRSPLVRRPGKAHVFRGVARSTRGSANATNARISLRRANSLRDLGLRGLQSRALVH